MQLSLQKKFILVAFVSVLLLTTVISFLAAAKTRDALYHATEKQGRMLAQTVSALIINELIYEKLGLVEEGGLIDNYMRELYQHPELDLNFAAVLSNDLKVISHSDFSEYGTYFGTEFIEAAQRSDTVRFRRISPAAGGSSSLEFAAPLAIEGKRWGLLYFSISLASVEEEVRALISLIMMLSVLALALLFILIYFLSRRFIKPIIDLSQAMEEVEVEMGEKTIHVSGSDELGQLTRSFNEMVERIRGANEEMKRAHEKLLQSEKLATLGILSSSIAHRVNNPLGGLFNCVKLLRKQGDDPTFRRNYLDLIEEGLDSIRRTVSQLLSTAGGGREKQGRVEVAEVLANVLRFLDYRLKKQNITFSSDIAPGLTADVAAHDLEELFLNTLLNAIQAMESGGRLDVAAARKNGTVEIVIADSGIGISRENLGRVFDPFYTTKRPGEGTGLGLWMTYELVKKYQGDIEIDSTEGVGTTVSLSIPEG